MIHYANQNTFILYVEIFVKSPLENQDMILFFCQQNFSEGDECERDNVRSGQMDKDDEVEMK